MIGIGPSPLLLYTHKGATVTHGFNLKSKACSDDEFSIQGSFVVILFKKIKNKK